MSAALDEIHRRFLSGFHESQAHEGVPHHHDRRIGAELKFPLVDRTGHAPPSTVVDALWRYLVEARGWRPKYDGDSRRVIGAHKPGEQNDTVASCETGYCKTEFSLAHASNLFDVERQLEEIREELRPFAEEHNVHFLGYGIQPVSRPGEKLVMKRNRTSFWDKIFPSNRIVREEDGDDFHIFTLNAASHVHVSVDRREAIRAVNALNGFAGAQIALTAHSSIWRGTVDREYRAVAEKFWDWWQPCSERAGVPPKAFENSRDYVDTIAKLEPVYVKRNGRPVMLKRYDSFIDYYERDEAVGTDIQGNEVSVVPAPQDIDVHNTCYWFNARVSQYFTVENRVFDQQPPGALLVPSALTLGLVSALHEALEEIREYHWDDLRTLRKVACKRPLPDSFHERRLERMCARMLDIAELGLRRRGLGEEALLEPLNVRFKNRASPSEEAERRFKEEGVEGLIEARSVVN